MQVRRGCHLSLLCGHVTSPGALHPCDLPPDAGLWLTGASRCSRRTALIAEPSNRCCRRATSPARAQLKCQRQGGAHARQGTQFGSSAHKTCHSTAIKQPCPLVFIGRRTDSSAKWGTGASLKAGPGQRQRGQPVPAVAPLKKDVQLGGAGAQTALPTYQGRRSAPRRTALPILFQPHRAA